ncbi:MAG: TetR/AcrR family transcriptional regulator, partial [Nitratireductor sp.]|nr:TetR/AcrR family transcriptional regulator [Nitratireductor sp.]
PLAKLLAELSRLIEVITASQTMLCFFLMETGYSGGGNCAPEFVETLAKFDQDLCRFLKTW